MVGAEISGHLLPSMPQSKEQSERNREEEQHSPGTYWDFPRINGVNSDFDSSPSQRRLPALTYAHEAASHVSIRLSHLWPDVFDWCLFIAIAAAA